MKYIRWFSELGIDDVAEVGGKNASLGELCRSLTPFGIRVPAGFAVTAEAYRLFLREAKLEARLAEWLEGIDARDITVTGPWSGAVLQTRVTRELRRPCRRS